MSTCPIKFKPRLAIFELTDCEGCELEILSLDKKLIDFTSQVEIVNWRLVDTKKDLGPFDICLIEGTVITKKEVEIIKHLRKISKIIIALGACACSGGIPSHIKEPDRKKFIKYVYGNRYIPLSQDAKPLNKYITVDYYLNGCPINPKELEDFLTKLISGQKIVSKYYPVCLECKSKQNSCLLINNEPCLGPITLGGCGALCPSMGVRCYGCWGPIKNANFQAMVKILEKQNRSKHEVKQIIELFMEENKDLKKILK